MAEARRPPAADGAAPVEASAPTAPAKAARQPKAARQAEAAAPPGKPNRQEPAVEPQAVCRVVYQDPWLLVVDKRPGFPVTPTAQHQERSVLRAVQRMGLGAAYPVSLLDREASGLVLLSRDQATATSLRWSWRSNVCERDYIAVVRGAIAGGRGRITLPLGVAQAGNRRRRGVLPLEQGGRPAETRWTLLARSRGLSRVLLSLRAGRCHQLRIHLAAIGHPIVNERTYLERNRETPLESLLEDLDLRRGDVRQLPKHQLALHAWRIRVPHPQTHEPMQFEAPIPRELLDLMPGAWLVDDRAGGTLS